MGANVKTKIFYILNYMFFTLLVLVMVYPLWYMLMISLSSSTKMSANIYYLTPNGFTLKVYKQLLSDPLIFSGYKNSLIVTLMGTAISLFLTVTTAYPLSKNNLSGRKYIMSFIMFTMLFNGGMIPTFLVVRSFGLVNSLWALIFLGAISVYNTMVMIKFFKNIPVELIESAYIDGYNDIAVLIKIVLPLSKAVLAAIGLFYAVGKWNAFLPGLIYLNDVKKWPIQVILYSFLSSLNMIEESGSLEATSEAYRMATAVIAVLPIVMVYPFLQKYFVKGIMLGSVKG